MCHDVALHARVVRCVGRHLAWARAAGDADATRAARAAGEALLPALGLIPANPGASNELWDVLSQMPTTTRFRLYAEWKATHVESDGGFGIDYGVPRVINPRCVLRSRRLAPSRRPTRKIMRRLSKENVKEFGRALGKVAHANPLAVFNAIVVQIEAYTNMIAPVTDAFKYLTAMGYDALTFVIVEKLAEGAKNSRTTDRTFRCGSPRSRRSAATSRRNTPGSNSPRCCNTW